MFQMNWRASIAQEPMAGIAEFDTAPLSTIRKTQDERLAACVEQAYRGSAYYRRLMDSLKLRPADVKSAEDLSRIPPTRFQGQHQATDFLAIPHERVTCVLTSPGPAGTLKTTLFSNADLDRWKAQFARLAAFWAIDRDDVIISCIPMPYFIEGLTATGARLVPFTSVSLDQDNQVKQLEQLRVTVIIAAPGRLSRLVQRTRELGIDLKSLGVKLVILVGESWSQTYRRRMEANLGAMFCDLYGSAEVGHPAAECSARNGMHVWEDLYVLELLDIETQQPVQPGQVGELVVTPMWRDAMPLIRYRTGDVATAMGHGRCTCGRNFSMITRIKGNLSDLVKVKNAYVFPRDVEEILLTHTECDGEFQLIKDHTGTQECLRIRVECGMDETPSASLRKRLGSEIARSLGVETDVELVHYGVLSRQGKFKVDRVVAG
ncbi:MAG: AMP-binding protein [Chloroflexi bacterium]|nr:AMP-binding protein [Chloroflexota bacterium]